MSESSLDKLTNQIQAHFNIILPVSGGIGATVDDPVVLDIDNANLIAPLQHAVLHYLTLFRGHTFEIESSKVIESEGGSKVIEQVKSTFSNDPTHYHTYFFDITRPWKSDTKPMVVSGNPYFPDSEVIIHSERQK